MSEKKEKTAQSAKEGISSNKFNKKPIKGTRFALMISSAKGGVGKSTFAVNIAFAFQNLGMKVGILDADIYGPSLPKLLALDAKPETKDGKFIIPIEKYGAQCISMGLLVNESTPMMWRGPMVISAIKTLTEKVLWSNLDLLVIDMPPGTGDTQLTFAQDIKIDGSIIISTPQSLALNDVKRGIQMFDKTGIKIIGLVDNMSFFEGDDGKKYDIFGGDGVEETAKEFGKDFLGKIPLHTDLRIASDKGRPLSLDLNNKISKIFNELAKKIKNTNFE